MNVFNNAYGIFLSGATFNHTCKNMSCSYNDVGISFSGGSSENSFISCSINNNTVGIRNEGSNSQYAGKNYLTNTTMTSNTTDFGTIFGSVGADDGLYSTNLNTAVNASISMRNGSIVSTTSPRHTSSGIAWALSPTSSTDRNSSFPLTLNVATVAVAANAPVTVKAWLRRSDTGLTIGLRILGNQIAGVSSDILSPITLGADTWEEVTLQFTPTANGVVQIQAYCYGGSTYNGYVDDLTITQA